MGQGIGGLNGRDLLETLTKELRVAWSSLRAAHPDERFYAFGIYTGQLAEYLMVTAATEEGLAAVTARYVRRFGGDEALQRSSLRWSPCDSPLHEEGEAALPLSNKLRCAGPDPYDESPEAEAAVGLAFDVAVEALRSLDGQGLFGTGRERDHLALGIWKGDQGTREVVEFVSALNPPRVVERFEHELEEGLQAFRRLSDDRDQCGSG